MRSASGLAFLRTVALSVPMLVASCVDEPERIDEEPGITDLIELGTDVISIDGTVVSTSPTAFVLDHGSGRITVEVDDWDFYQEGNALRAGDRVGVTGRVDENLFAASTIEAGAVYVENLNTMFYANPGDEEGAGTASFPAPDGAASVDYTGRVTSASDDGFTLGSGPTQIQVDTSNLQTPLAPGQVETGERVYVWGDLVISSEGRSRLVADGLMELVEDPDRAATDASR